MKREEIKEKKRHGDLVTAALMIDVTPNHAAAIWMRPLSKRYPDLEKALIKIIKSRETVLGIKENQPINL